MPLTRSQTSNQRKSISSSKRRKTSQARCCLSVYRLPDAILGYIADFLPKSSQALFAVAIARALSEESLAVCSCHISSSTKLNCTWNNEQWETLDFADLEKDLASKLTDDDLNDILNCTGAPKKLKTLKLTGCVGLVGHGLRSLRGSVALRQIDLSLVDQHECPTLKPEPMLSKTVTMLTLNSVVDTFGNSLRHIQLPKLWRDESSPAMESFLAKYNKGLNKRFIGCSKCDNVIWGGKEERQWVVSSGSNKGLQNFTCYQCTNRFCLECDGENTPHFCEHCEKKFCADCVQTKQCAHCYEIACSECATIEECLGCRGNFCTDCIPVETCSFCNLTRCMDCRPQNWCEGEDCYKSNCLQCQDENNVRWCECCEREFCSDCRLKEYYKDRNNFCWGCRGLLFNMLANENESLRQRIEVLQNQHPSA